MTEQLYSLIREYTNLTEVQARILTYLPAALNFAADISRNQVYICAKGKNKDMMVILSASKPSFDTGKTHLMEGDTFLSEEVAIATSVLWSGEKVVGRKELEIGRIVGVTAYPILDNAGVPFAVVGFMANHLEQQQILTDTAYQMLQLPLSQEEYRQVRPQDGILILDAVGRILYANDTASGLYLVMDRDGSNKESVAGKILSRLPLIQKVRETGRPDCQEERIEDVTLFIWAFPLLKDGRVIRTILLVSDVTVVREKERQILVKESVIKEIHHRVKNSLNTVAGLLRMQMRRSGDEDTKQALKKAVDRILSISQVHDVLAHQSGEDIDWNMLLNKLCDLSVKSLGNRSWELLREELQTSIILNSEKAVHLSIAVNELIQNAIRHGVSNQVGGILVVKDWMDTDGLHIVIKNNGKQLPDNFNSHSYGLGLQIVKTLVELELRGEFLFRNEEEMVVAEIICPIGDVG